MHLRKALLLFYFLGSNIYIISSNKMGMTSNYSFVPPPPSPGMTNAETTSNSSNSSVGPSYSKLASHLAHRQWDKAIAILTTNEGRVMTNEADRHGRYPIHQALLLGAPANVIEALIHANPTHALLACANGDIPLHMCLEPHVAVADDFRPDDEVFHALFSGFEEAAKLVNPQKRLPLELALKHQASDEIVFALIQAFPQAVINLHRHKQDILCLAMDDQASVPVQLKLLDILRDIGGGVDVDPVDAAQESFRRLRYAMEKGAADELILALLEQPYANVLNDKNESLLHIALRNKYSETVVLALIDKSPTSAKVPDGELYIKNIIISFQYIHEHSISDYFFQMVFLFSLLFFSTALGYMPLHRALVHKSSDEVVLRLVQEYPEAAVSPIQNRVGGPDITPLTVAFQTKRTGKVVQAIMGAKADQLNVVDDNGDLPLHQVIKLGAPEDTILTVLNFWNDAAKMKDKSGYLPLHLAIKHSASASTIIGIVHAWPEATQQMDKSGDLPLHQALNFSAPADAVMAILNAWTVAAMLKNQETDKLPIHYAVVRATHPKVIDALLRVYPQSLDAICVNDKGRAFTARDMATHVLPEESIRLVMKPVSYWERLVSTTGGVEKDVETTTFDALSAVVDELEAKFRHGQDREQLLLEKIRGLEEKLRRLSANMNASSKAYSVPAENGMVDYLE